MRFTTAALALTLATTTTTTNAFLPHLVTPHRHLHTILKSTSEWSNDDFLESLGKSQDDIANANEKYYRYSEAKANMNQWMAEQQQQPGRPTVPLDVEGMEQPLAPQGMQQQPPPDGMQQPGVSSGGERFRRMVEQQQQQQGPPPPMDMYAQQQQQQPPSPYAQQPPPVAQQPPPPAMDPYAQQPPPPAMDPYAQQQQQQQPPPYPPQYQYPPQDPYTQQQPPYPQQQQQQPPYPPQDPNAPQSYPPQQQPPPYYPPQQQQQQQPYPPPPQPQKPGPGPGRNPDAHTIANTSDLYLEQLKLDSRIRKGAFLRGDTEKAQQVFEDPNVQQLKDVLQDNPYLRAKTTGNAVETSEDEMVAVMRQTAMSTRGKSAKMVSYRDKLKERQLKKKAEPVVATSEPVQVAPPEPVQVIPPTSPQVDTPVPQTATIPPPPSPQPTIITNEQQPYDEETSRRQIRTTMGLLLKHRGGPGFGAGLLKQPEAQRMVDAVAETSRLLRSELTTTQEVTQVTNDKEVLKPPIMSVEQRPTDADTTTTTSFLDPSIQCAEAALQMVKTAPASEQSKLLPSLRDALVSTIDRLNQVIETEVGSMTEQEQQQQQQPQRGMQSFAEVASDMSLPNWTQLEQETTPPEVVVPSMEETTSANKEEQTREVVAPKEHMQLLKTTLAQLTTAKGNGKLGLDPSLTADDAAKLVDSLEGLRTVLLNELDMAPKSREDSVQTENVVEVEPESQGGSKYQEMLAKAKAVKEEKNVA